MIFNTLKNEKKKFIVTIIILIFSIITISFVVFSKIYIKNNYIKIIENKIENRSFVVGKDDCNSYECLNKYLNESLIYKKYKYVDDFFGYNSYFSSVSFKIGINDFLPDVVSGNKFTSDKKNEIIIPKYFKLNNKIVNTSNLIGKIINFKINYHDNEIDYNPKVIGIYDNKDNINDISLVYFSVNDLDNFSKYIDIKELLIIIEDESEKELLFKNLKEQGYYYNYFDDNSFKELMSYKRLYSLIKIYEITLIIIIGIITSVYIYIILDDEKQNIALKKAVGYTEFDILKRFLFEIIILFSISYYIVNIFFLVCLRIFYKLLLTEFLIKIIILYIISVFEMFLICLIIMYKVKKIEIINMLKQ